MKSHCANAYVTTRVTAALAQWVRTLAPQAEGRVFESLPRQTKVVKTGSNSFTANRSAVGASVTGPRILITINEFPVSRQRTLTAQWPWVPSIGQNLQPFSLSGMINQKNKQTNKQTNHACLRSRHVSFMSNADGLVNEWQTVDLKRVELTTYRFIAQTLYTITIYTITTRTPKKLSVSGLFFCFLKNVVSTYFSLHHSF